ncbi:hypothetical protein ACM66B_003637 [Microbotryomycetes sp. NB124-2]
MRCHAASIVLVFLAHVGSGYAGNLSTIPLPPINDSPASGDDLSTASFTRYDLPLNTTVACGCDSTSSLYPVAAINQAVYGSTISTNARLTNGATPPRVNPTTAGQQHNGYHEAYSQQHHYTTQPPQYQYQQHQQQPHAAATRHHAAVPSSGASASSGTSRSSSSAHPKQSVAAPTTTAHRASGMPALKQPAAPKQARAEEAAGAKVKRTRNRKPSSCVQCRKKKLRCNRASPCDQCTLKGEQCNWDDAVPLFDARAEHDADELRAQVRRLEALVAHLTSQQESSSNARSSSPSSSASGERSPGDDHAHSPTVVQFPSAGRPSLRPSLSSESQSNKTKLDLRANDLCEGLAKLVIKEYCVVDGSGEESWAPNGQRGTPFIDEAASFLANMPQNFGLTSEMPKFAPRGFGGGGSASVSGDQVQSPGPSEASTMSSEPSPGPLGSSSFHRAAPPLSEALKYLPTPKEAMSAYTYYSGYVSWYAHIVHLPSFEQQWAQLYEALKLDEEQRAKQIDPFFVATFLGVCATSLAMMPTKRALRDGFGSQKSKTVDKWLEGAMVALTCGRFLDNPSVDSVRSVTVLCTYFVFMAHGESSGAGMGLLSLAVQVAMSLNLHRDPDRTPGKFTFFEAENRRRLFWSLFALCILSSASLGRTWAVFDLNHVDCKLPLDCHDHEIFDQATAEAAVASRKRKFEETPMTSLLLRAKLAVMAKKINDKAFGIHPCSYSTVLELDKDLKEFEDSIPSRYQLRLDSVGALVRRSPHVTVTEMRACMLHISICTEFIRIHRPWLVLAGSNELYQFSRDRLIQYAKMMIAIYRSPSCSNHPWGGMTYKAASAAVVLAIDILTFPTGGEVESIRALLKATASQMERWEKESCISRKGARVIRFLLAKEAAVTAQREQRRDQRTGKRARTTDYSSFPNHTVRQTLDPLFEEYPLVQTGLREDHPAEDHELRRRVPESYVETPSYAASVVSYESATPAQTEAPEQPRVAAPLPRSSLSSAAAAALPTPTSAVDATFIPDVYDLNFGVPGSILNDFAFDFAVPTSTFDLGGDLQYQLSSGNSSISLPLDLSALDATGVVDPAKLDSNSQKSSQPSGFSYGNNNGGLLTPVSQGPLPLTSNMAALTKHGVPNMVPTYSSPAVPTPVSHVGYY